MKAARISGSRRRIRIGGLLILVLLLAWLPIEDLHEGWVIAYAAIVCAWGATRHLGGLEAAQRLHWTRYVLVGGLAGMLLTPAALMLMLFKNGLHAHSAPDFSAYQMARVIELTPAWVAAGMLIGLGGGLWKLARSR